MIHVRRGGNVLDRSTEDILPCNRKPSSNRAVELSEVIAHAHIRCVTDLGLGHGEMRAGCSDTDRCRETDTSSTAH